MSQKRLVIVSPAHPYRGGQALVESYLYHNLSSVGYEVQTISYTLLYPSVFFPGTTQFDSSKLIPFPHPKAIRRLLNAVNPVSWYRTARAIKKMKPDGVIFVWWMPFFGPALGTIAALLKRMCRTKIFFLVENYVSHENRWFDRIATLRTLKYADAFITESNFVTAQTKKDFPHKPLCQATLSVYDCYNQNQYTQETARAKLGITTEHVVLFFGLIRPYKGLDKLIEAFPAFLEKQPDTTLLIVGESYEDKGKYESRIQSLGLGARTKFIDRFVPNEEVELFYKAADVVCLPYNSATQSGILMMAYGFRKPVVVTDVGGLAELVEEGKTGFLIRDNSPENLVKGLSGFFQKKESEDFAGNIDTFIAGLGYEKLAGFIAQMLEQEQEQHHE